MDCDLATRGMLANPDALEAAAMVRSWPEVVQAAHELLGALPTAQRVVRPGEEAADLVGERLHLMATAMDAQLRRRPWPGPGPADDELQNVAENLLRAHDLVRRYLRTADTPAPVLVADADAARTRILHTLYVGSHALTVAVRSMSGALQAREMKARPDAVSARQRRAQASALSVALSRLDAFEQVAGAEVYRYFPEALGGEHRESPVADRLSTAIVHWDVAAHRAMARSPSMATLVELTRVQTSLLAVTRVVLNAASMFDIADTHLDSTQLEPQLTAAESAWGFLHSTLRDLTANRHRAATVQLRSAGAELVHALTELVLDGTSVAEPATIAARIDVAATARTLAGALVAPHHKSALLLDAALHDGTRVSARGAQQLLTRLAGVPGSGVSASPQQSWLDPADVTAGRDIPPPAPIREAISHNIHTVDARSSLLAAAAIAATTPSRRPLPDPSHRTRSVGPELHQRQPALQRAAQYSRR
ncbi:hypothetical protein [Knoellia aerolata]|uniref:hypothetical protein n=1 Tax=Knoellia aerolata TaxID=442954 RepID=UPI0012EE7463|nr:hypothetical protein [Knoellia aerolata]